jgi:signal transduction histidine kinase/CheY-like chemotaxis protein/HPt (histidine-containing phosphotransfer) domain-containing protein
MVQKPKSIKYKVVSGYLLLFAVAVVSVWFIYNEILKIAGPYEANADNTKIIRISNTIADLYASEAVGRNYIVTESSADYKKYVKLLDSINREIEFIKKGLETAQVQKFDSIQLLLKRKKKSVDDLIQFRKNNSWEKTFKKAGNKVYNVKDSMFDLIKPVRSTKSYQWRDLVNAALTQAQQDSLGKTPIANDSLVMAFDNMITDLINKDNRIRYQEQRKEAKLLEENRIITDQLRIVLNSVEKELIQKSYDKFNKAQFKVQDTIKTMAWVGAITFLVLIIFASIIIRDLTQSQNYRSRLELLNQENEELLRSKTMLMATVTHDLQTPLGSIVGFHDLLKKSGVSLKQDQYLDNIKDSADYILKLVNDLLDFSRLENNRITIEQKAFNVKTAIESACKALEPMALNKEIELNWDIDEQLNGNFVSDAYRIKQVLTNLISNAVKFTAEGSVEVTAKIEDNTIVISVLDTGIGISRGNHDSVFREFTQAHSGIEKKFGGTGLGLTISKRIVELLGGSITLESEEGQGSIFTVAFPCVPAEGLLPDEVVPAAAMPAIMDKRILVVDDDKVQLALMRELLHGHIGVVTEINAPAVLALLENNHFDMLLTDIQMPVMDGFELIKQIRQHKDVRIAGLPVIALSGRRDLTTVHFIEKGFTAHHTKPLQLELLLAVIAAVFNGDTPPVFNGEMEIQKPFAAPLYNLRSLSQFTNNDPVSLATILDTFIASAVENCEALQQACADKDYDRLAQVAHKMIPMLKQMEVYSIANMLMPIEDHDHDMDDVALTAYIDVICEKMLKLCSALTAEIH